MGLSQGAGPRISHSHDLVAYECYWDLQILPSWSLGPMICTSASTPALLTTPAEFSDWKSDNSTGLIRKCNGSSSHVVPIPATRNPCPIFMVHVPYKHC